MESSPLAKSPPCNIIYVKEKTFLCRWGREDEGFCRVQSQPQQRKLKRQTPTSNSSDTTITKGERDGHKNEEGAPHEKYKDASEKSGIQLGNVSLVPLRFPTTKVVPGKQIKNAHADPCQPFSTILSQLGKEGNARVSIANRAGNGSDSSSPP